MRKICISQRMLVTFFSCDEHATYHLREISLGFCVPKNNLNHLIFDGVIHEIKGARFYWDSVEWCNNSTSGDCK